ncbi:MAG TPA: DinB family protein [Blastocatellia bacterium]|nr:DinB family protein [Blastocatellia bacterium]
MTRESHDLAELLLSKLEEQIERTEHLLTLIPADKLEWRPLPESLRVCDLLGHLLECLAGFCAALFAVNPEGLAHFVNLKDRPVNHCCEIEESRTRITEYSKCIREGFALIGDDDLARRIPTVFVQQGEAVMSILLGNLEHLINHKYQLFFYLKLMGVEVGTADLYRVR